MVSQPEHSRTLSLRPPASVVSRVSTSRSRRHGRSQTGGSSYIPQNDFPVFTHTGDVEILIKAGGVEDRYLLHRLILAQCSGFFEASTSQPWSRAVTDNGSGSHGDLNHIREDSGNETSKSTALSAPRKRWRYELDPGTSPDDIPMLIQKDTSSQSLFSGAPPAVRNKPPTSSPSFFRSVASLSLPATTPRSPTEALTQTHQDILRDYSNLFRIFYNHPPSLSLSIGEAYLQCKSLLTLADLYDALPVVGPRIDHHLLQFRSRLWKQIAKYPPSYLRLGYLARSKSIFAEALIHVVGQWPVGERYLRSQLPQAVMEIIEDKVDELADAVAVVEAKLLRLSLVTAKGERVGPGNSFLDWLVVSLFRQHIIEATSAPPLPKSRGNNGSDLPPSSLHRISNLGHVFRTLHAGGPAYLNHDECKKFLKHTSDLYSRDNLRRFERRMEELKGLAAVCVEGMVVSELEGGGGSVGYLTCIRVVEEDFPWDESSE
jgi:hypothetical protein